MGADNEQVAYLMADISDVDTGNIKDLYQKLESLSCMDSHLRHITLLDC